MIEKIDDNGKRYLELELQDLETLDKKTKVYFIDNKLAIPPADCKHEFYTMFGIKACKKCIYWEEETPGAGPFLWGPHDPGGEA